jgi:hypothetical protein
MKLPILFILLLSFCNRTSPEYKLKQAISNNDFLMIANICSEYKYEKYQKECEQALNDSILEIEKILSQKKHIPFVKIIIEKDKARKIQDLLQNNIELSIKYRSIWNEATELTD